MDLQLSNVINISVAAAQTGIGEFNTSNLGIFTDAPYGNGFGTDGYKIYLEPTEVATDFGSDSTVYAMALSVFSQKPNILAGGGYLSVIAMTPETQTLAFSGTPASGSFKLNYGGNATGVIAYNATASDVQTALRLLDGLELVTVTGSIPVGMTVNFKGVYGDISLMTVTSNTMQTGGAVAVTVTVAQGTAGETLAQAITRSEDLVQYFGLMADVILDQTNLEAAAAVIQALNKVGFFVQTDPTTVEVGGLIDDIAVAGYTQTRCLFYGDDADNSDPLEFQAAYAGRALSVDFDGSNTTQTMHLKDLTGILPDDTMTQTLLNKCLAAGADTYVSIQGVAKTFCSGLNDFFDQVYNLQAFVGSLQVAGFNALATASNKVPQTEQGVAILTGAYRAVCEQFRTNQYIAPGAWNSPTTFGNQGDFMRNVEERGYYVYAAPVALQSQANREARVAPLVQIAVKEAGAIHSSSVVIYVNA